jgi:hypothetical protein
MYFCDTPERVIWAFDYGPGPPGRLSALRVFHSKSVLYGGFV